MTYSFLQYGNSQSWLRRAILQLCALSLISFPEITSQTIIFLPLRICYLVSLQGMCPPKWYLETFTNISLWMDTCFARCLILRVNGELSLLDLDEGRERELTDSVELFWVTCGQSEEKVNLIEEVSWLDYGHRGMQVMNCWGLLNFNTLNHLVYYDLPLVLVICTCLI